MQAMQNPTEPSVMNPADCNCLALRQAARRVSQFYESFLSPLGLKSSQYSILARLDRLGAMSINEIAQSLVMDRTTTGRAIRPLERDGLVRIGTAEDGRKRMVNLTAAGRRRADEARDAWQRAQEQFERAYGSQAAQSLRAAMSDVVKAIPETGAA
jgi:DNA-binding MarR family transcriptional regulator